MDTTLMIAWLYKVLLLLLAIIISSYSYHLKGLHGVTDLHWNVLSLHHLYYLSSEPGQYHLG